MHVIDGNTSPSGQNNQLSTQAEFQKIASGDPSGVRRRTKLERYEPLSAHNFSQTGPDWRAKNPKNATRNDQAKHTHMSGSSE
jgi:hypothetical protein